MPPGLEHRLSDLRRRVQQALVVYGLSWLASVAIGATLVFCLADWFFHFDDMGVRLILGLTVFAAAAWVAYRYLVTPLRVPFSDVDLALRIEDRFPGFNDSLASSVQFLERAGDPQIGSPALQQAVIRDSLSRLANLDTGDVLETREVRRMALLATAVALVAATIAVRDTTQTSIALRRLLLPFSAPAWPRQTDLRLLSADLEPLDNLPDPVQIARGDVFKLFAENQVGRLPDKVTLEFRNDDGRTVSEAMRPMTVNGPDGRSREVAVGQLTALKGETQFRAVGGDDLDMPWRRLRVIPPPVVEHLRVTLTPPPYAKLPVEELPEGAGQIQGLLGTRVEIAGTASKPLQSAAIRVRDQQRYPIEIAGESRRISASFLITEPGIYSWWFDLKDAEGFENAEPQRYEIRGTVDGEPEIRIDLPASDLQVTPEVTLPVRTVARDDLGLREIRLVFRREEDEPTKATAIGLFDGEGRPRERTVDYAWNLSELGLTDGMRIVFHTEATDEFDLTEVYPAGKAPPLHVGRSVARILSVVSKEKKTQELAQRQASLLDDLERAFKQQKQTREQVGELQLQAQNAGKFRPEDLDVLQRTEIGQRDVTGQLRHPATGLERRARDLLDELRGNHLDDPQSERRLSDIAGELERLGDDHFPIIEQELTQARKLLQAGERRPPGSKAADPAGGSEAGDNEKTEATERLPGAATPDAKQRGDVPGDRDRIDQEAKRESKESRAASDRSHAKPDDAPSSAADKADKSPGKEATPSKRARPSRPADRPETALKQVAENQDAVLDVLSELLQELSQWRTEHDAGRDLAEMIKQQDEINRKTGELAKQTLTKPGEKLAPQEKADLAKLAERQKKQADQLDQLETRMQEKLENQSQSTPNTAASLKDALDQARDQGIAEQMREAAGQVSENRMGEAARSQEQVLEKLRDLENTLNDSRDSDTEVLVKKLKQAEHDIQSLRDRELELLRKVEEASKQADPARRHEELERLQKEQEQLREETARMARHLQRLNARRPSAAAGRAAGRMQRAGEQLDEGEQAEAAAQQQEALDDLEQAQRELARDRRRAEEQLAREQLDRIGSELSAMIDREQAVVDEMKRLDAIHQSAGKFTRGQLLALRDLTSVQRNLKEDTDRLVDKLTSAEVFAKALRGAARSMQAAVDLLEDRKTGTETQRNAGHARQRFVNLIEALKQDEGDGVSKPPPDQQQQGNGGDNPKREGPQTDGIPAIAQLKMLLSLQRELLERTTRLSELRAKNIPLSPADQAELEALATEQADLAELARNLSFFATEPADDAPADDPRQSEDGGPNGKREKEEGAPKNE